MFENDSKKQEYAERLEKYKDTGSRKAIGMLLHKCGKVMYFGSRFGVQQTEILKLLKDGPLSQKDIQEHLGVQPATVSELISKLESKEYVTRERSESDKRVVMLTLTDIGAKILEKRIRETPFNKVEICLDDDEQKALIVLLDKLNEGFENSSTN